MTTEQTLQERLRSCPPISITQLSKMMIDAADRIDDLERQFAEAQKDQADAQRYRWLRDNTLVDGEINEELYVAVDSDKFPDNWVLVEEDLDQAIDAAIAQKKVKT